MAFAAKHDWFGLADDALKVSKDSDGASSQNVEATGADGSIVANEIFGEAFAPSCDYVMAAAVNWEAGKHPIGQLTENADGVKVVLTNLSINCSAGAAPTISASGESVAADAVQGCTYDYGALQIPLSHHAHILMDAAKVTGDGVHLTSAAYTFEASLTKSTVNGDVLSHDVTAGKITCQISLVQVGSVKPTITPGEGWQITSPLSYDNPDANYKTWSATLTKYLTKTVAE